MGKFSSTFKSTKLLYKNMSGDLPTQKKLSAKMDILHFMNPLSGGFPMIFRPQKTTDTCHLGWQNMYIKSKMYPHSKRTLALVSISITYCSYCTYKLTRLHACFSYHQLFMLTPDLFKTLICIFRLGGDCKLQSVTNIIKIIIHVHVCLKHSLVLFP